VKNYYKQPQIKKKDTQSRRVRCLDKILLKLLFFKFNFLLPAFNTKVSPPEKGVKMKSRKSDASTIHI
jgi:hypothetical protein